MTGELRFPILCVVASLGVGACFGPRSLAPLPIQSEIYLVAIDHLGWATSSEPWVLTDRTSTLPPNAPLLDLVPSELRESFARENALEHRIPDGAFPSDRFLLASRDSLAALRGGSARQYWRAFREAFPEVGWLLTISAVGYSADGLRAAVWLSAGCASLCGESHLVVLRREPAGWVVESARLLLVS